MASANCRPSRGSDRANSIWRIAKEESLHAVQALGRGNAAIARMSRLSNTSVSAHSCRARRHRRWLEPGRRLESPGSETTTEIRGKSRAARELTFGSFRGSTDRYTPGGRCTDEETPSRRFAFSASPLWRDRQPAAFCRVRAAPAQEQERAPWAAGVEHTRELNRAQVLASEPFGLVLAH